MSDRLLPDPSPALADAFRAVQAQRMQGLPFLNPAIEVEAVAFVPWKQYWLGAMVTPWSINLLLAPRDPGAFRPLPAGEKRRCLFPAGELGEVNVATQLHETPPEGGSVFRLVFTDTGRWEE